ncbi:MULTISPECIES: DUF305 domain-containing protein [unclassified Psychrobacter]|uniref:CopM family metallochaperone n=1 Tax=unclassified Psychrobacter TaxID=196806 RepID=UPI0018F563D5|nr:MULTISPECIES: DUF305 domain-containing protein [unclassified Psychrobacter]
MITSFRFAPLALCLATAAALSACQPKEEATTTSPETVAVDETPATEDTTAPTDDPASETPEPAQDSVLDTDVYKDYVQSMEKMHTEMMIAADYKDPDVAFAKGMLGHHRGAIDMAKLQLKYGSNSELTALAQQVIDTQQGEIDILKKWLASHLDSVNPKPNTEAMQQDYAESMRIMHYSMEQGMSDPTPDLAFARSMLAHHIGAIEMAKSELKYGTDEEMRSLAQTIIDAQLKEVADMLYLIATIESASPVVAADDVDPNTQVTSDDMPMDEHAAHMAADADNDKPASAQ